MKHIVILTDGMADEPCPELGGRTPLEAAQIPVTDRLARQGRIGLVRTVPEGMPPGSDVANLAVMGYDPARYHTGRSPLEAASLGISLEDSDISFRCNLVSLSEEKEYRDRRMLDYSAGEISTGEALSLVGALRPVLEDENFSLVPGTSYRHILVWKDGGRGVCCTPPHDITGEIVGPHLPQGRESEMLFSRMLRSAGILAGHPVNESRRARGLRTADSVWFWGPGRRARLDPFREKTGLRGAVISAVDLIKGIAVTAGMEVLDVPGATGTLDTDFAGKREALLRALRDGVDYVYLHVEAADECGHQKDLAGKIQAMERIEEDIVSPLVAALEASREPFRILVLSDHPTPVRLGTHTSDPVPFVLYDSTGVRDDHPEHAYSEPAAARSPERFSSGVDLAREFLSGGRP